MKNKSKKIIVTGGAGFIGTNVIRSLNAAGYDDIVVVDHLTNTGKWKNLVPLHYSAYYDRDEFLHVLPSFRDVEAIIHLGACSSTMEVDENFLLSNNSIYSKKLFDYSIEHGCRFIYASSAATYGNGNKRYHDQEEELSPLNCYGYSKHLFDSWVRKSQEKPVQWVGLKFFNVYGPYEDHKEKMASMVYHGFHQITQTGGIKLFKSYDKAYGDGGQLRDFIYVDDVVDVILFFLGHKEKSGIFNVGTGKSRSFKDLAMALFSAMEKKPNITYIPMPPELRSQYQYFTQADMSSLRNVGYTPSFFELEEGIYKYVTSYLLPSVAGHVKAL